MHGFEIGAFGVALVANAMTFPSSLGGVVCLELVAVHFTASQSCLQRRECESRVYGQILNNVLILVKDWYGILFEIGMWLSHSCVSIMRRSRSDMLSCCNCRT
jgi:hypothetical protein